tara:strand:+ start:25811 stop:26083 length:273 start_codon:yes stop_codon:yes gene_type:complete
MKQQAVRELVPPLSLLLYYNAYRLQGSLALGSVTWDAGTYSTGIYWPTFSYQQYSSVLYAAVGAGSVNHLSQVNNLYWEGQVTSRLGSLS